MNLLCNFKKKVYIPCYMPNREANDLWQVFCSALKFYVDF